jgi:sarcosine oxidase subunit beta
MIQAMMQSKSSAKNTYDVIVIGAGSIGVPTVYYLAKAGFKVMVVDNEASVGQGSNKKAIGGVRATHSDPVKVRLCQRSIEILSNWRELTGDNIEWTKGGYCFVAYREKEKDILNEILAIQHGLGLNISWLDHKQILEVVPDFNPEGLLGGTFSPEDGNASPLLTIHSYMVQAMSQKAEFRFNEKVIATIKEKERVVGIRTSHGKYYANTIINAAGAWANPVSNLFGEDLPVTPDSHESAITEPVAAFLKPMIVDIRPSPGSANYYFYQHCTGQVIFCITPNPSIWGENTQETSDFLPMVARRIVQIMPRLKNIRVRRTWRGLYPMTPDGFPLIGLSKNTPGYLIAAGMCGQGFMLGPGVGELVTRIVANQLTNDDYEILRVLSPYRSFQQSELLK